MKKLCAFPGCPTLVNVGVTRCQRHAKKGDPRRDYERHRQADPELMAAAKFRSSSKWQKVRKLKLSESPLCEDPFKDHLETGATVLASQVHHIKSLAKYPEYGLHLANLMSVCPKCHSRLSAEERS